MLILLLNLTLGSVFSCFSPKIYIFIASFTLLQDVDAASDGYLPEPHVKFMQCVRMCRLIGLEENSSFPLAAFLKACPVSRVSDSSCTVEHVF